MSNNPQFDAVAEFNTAFGHAVRDTPSLDHEDLTLRLNIFLEEVDEIVEAIYTYRDGGLSHDEALVEVLDGMADTLVTLYGLAQATGLPVTEAFDIVHQSNMSKLGPDGNPVYYTDGPKKGKIAKGLDYWAPTDRLRKLIKFRMSDD